jgi:hypothetical protein
MKRLILLAVVCGILAGGAAAQTLTGGISVTGLAGYKTNAYLDPVVSEWERSLPPGYAAVMPGGQLAWSTEKLRMDLYATGRRDRFSIDTTRSSLARIGASTVYSISPHWRIGGDLGIRRYTLTDQVTETAWVLSRVQWQPAASGEVTFRLGWSGRGGPSDETADRYHTGLAVLNGQVWMTDRLLTELSLYYSDSRGGATRFSYGGTGAAFEMEYWPTDALSLQLSGGLERMDYEAFYESTDGGTSSEDSNASYTWKNLMWKGGLEARYRMTSNLTVFGRGRLMHTTRSFDAVSTEDQLLSAGVRFQLKRILAGGRAEGRSDLWRKSDGGMRLEIPYTGNGELYLTGDFNGWACPGIPLEEVAPNRYSVTLDVSAGRYLYGIRVVEGEKQRWLDLPGRARTVSDGFGGTNGVLVIDG